MRWKIILPIAAVVVAVVVVLALTGGDSKEDKALAKVCGARADIQTQLQTLKGLSVGNGAAGKAKQSLQAIAADVRTIADARSDLADSRRAQVNEAQDAFVSSVKDTVGGVTGLASLQSAGPQLKDAAVKLANTYKTSYGKIDCSKS